MVHVATEPRTVRVAALAFLGTVLAVTPFTATLVGDGPWWMDPSVLASAAAIPFVVVAWLWAESHTRRAGQVLTAGLAITAWMFTYFIQGSGYLVGNYAYLAVIVVAAAFLVSVKETITYAIVNVGVIMLVWSTTGLGVTDLVLSLAYQAMFGVLLIGLARHLERAREQALDLAAELGRAKETTDKVLASTWDSIFVIDDGQIVEANRRGEEWVLQWFGRALRLPQPLPDLLGGFDDVLRIVDTGDAENETSIHAPQGERRVQVRSVTQGLGGVTALFVRDVTDERDRQAAEAKRIQQEAELHALKSQQEWQRRFMNMASHELRTPLTPIRLQMEMIKDRTDPAVEVMDRNVRRLEALIDDILDVVRLDQDRLPLRLEATDVSAVIEQQVAGWRPMAQKKGIDMAVDGGGGVWASADPKRLAQILDNILGNAIKYTDAGTISIQVQDGDAVSISITDTGTGFDSQDAGRIFEPFTRLEHHLEQDGTGLGMAICRSFAEAMGGHLEAHSDGMGKGATFRLRLPRVDA